MKTSYFAKYRGKSGVCIALKHPIDFHGKCYSDLFPKWSFLKKYFEDRDEKTYTKEYYKQVLNHLDPKKVYNDLKDKTLLCWEKPGEFCHRRIVAKWIEDNLNVKVKER